MDIGKLYKIFVSVMEGGGLNLMRIVFPFHREGFLKTSADIFNLITKTVQQPQKYR